MKKLMTFCFVILMSVLSGLSCFNFAVDALDRIEEDKIIVNIVKPETINNKDFLEDIDGAVKRVDADIMLRQVQNLGGKDHYKYFKTNNTERFLDISTNAKSKKLAAGECISTIKQDGYKTFRLNASSLMQNITFYPWDEADTCDLSSSTYFVEKDHQDTVIEAIQALGYDVSVNPTVYISYKLSVLLFGFVPAFMLIASMAFYVLSGGKRNVLKKMEGYNTLDIMKDEAKHICPTFAASFLIVEAVSFIVAAILYRTALLQYILFSLPNIVILIVTLLIGTLLASLLIRRQKSAEYIKGRVPRRGIYITTIIAKGVFVGFLIFFLSIAIRNATISHNTMQTFQFFADKVNGYVTVPVYNSNASTQNMSQNYKEFYLATVKRYNGVLVDANNYEYDLISGKTMAEEFGQTEITVNRNYLDFNPIYSVDGSAITDAQLSNTDFNVLIPASKENEQEKENWREYIMASFGMKTNFITYDDAGSQIFSYNANAGTGAYGALEAPVILVIEDEQVEGAFVLSYCSQGAYFLKVPGEDAYTELLPIMQETGIASTTLKTPSVAETFSKTINHQRQMLLLYGTQSVVLLIGLLCLIVFSAKLYCENYKSKIACCLIEGYSILHSIRKHLMITAIYYAVVVTCVGFITMTMQLSLNDLLLLLIFIGELAITIMVSRGYSKNNLYQIVKGAE